MYISQHTDTLTDRYMKKQQHLPCKGYAEHFVNQTEHKTIWYNFYDLEQHNQYWGENWKRKDETFQLLEEKLYALRKYLFTGMHI